MGQDTGGSARLALLIDADNVSYDTIRGIMEIIEQKAYGWPVIRRAYQNWSVETLKTWQPTLSAYSIEPMRVFSGERGTKASDIELVVDAMDLLYTRSIDAFCIVSGDSDFTRLVYRLRESGMGVVGFGTESKSAESLRRACDEFHIIYGSPARMVNDDIPIQPGASKATVGPAQVILDILRACDVCSAGLPLTALGTRLRKQGIVVKPALKKFIETKLSDEVEVESETAKSGTGTTHHVRLKRSGAKLAQRASQPKPTAGRGPNSAVSPAPSPPGKEPP